MTPEEVRKEILYAIDHLQEGDTFRYESDMLIDVANRMIERGGSFVKLVGEMYFRADGSNQRRLLMTWPEYFIQYASPDSI